MPQYTDQLNRTLTLTSPPKRIISLVPSQTELLADLGVDNEVVGITTFCVHPDRWCQTKKRVGGTKNFKIDRIHALQPDLIIGNKEENEQAGIEELMRHYPVWMSDIYTLEDALDMIQKIGGLVNKQQEATILTTGILKKITFLPKAKPAKVAYLIWQAPYMVAGNQTFIHEMLGLCGFENAFAHWNRYPVVTIEQLVDVQPNVIFLSSEPYPFKQKHLVVIQSLVPDARVFLVDGEFFSWYGSRLLKAMNYFKEKLLIDWK